MEPGVDVVEGRDHLEKADDHQYQDEKDDGQYDLPSPLRIYVVI